MKDNIKIEQNILIWEYKGQKFEIDDSIKDYLNGKLQLSKEIEHSFKNVIEVLDKTSGDAMYPYKVKSEPLVSIILVNYNGLEHNEACIKSIQNQSYKNIEIVMVNNSSEDGSIDVVREKFPQVQIVDPKMNTGFAKGNNIGVRASKGDYIFILNNDTELEKDAVKNLVAFAHNNTGIGAIAAKMKFYWNKNVINSFGNTIFLDNWGSDNFINFIDFGQFNLPRQVMSACFGAVFIPREVWNRVGELDEKMFMYYEDSDWSYRARLLGYDIVASPYSIVYHKFGASTSTRPSAFKNKMVVRNRLIWVMKNLEKRMCLFTLKNYIKADIFDSLRFLKNGETAVFRSYFGAYFSLLILSPRILANRHQIQKVRMVSDKEILSLSVPINSEVYHSHLPKLTVRTLRKYYSDNIFTIKSGNWLDLRGSNWNVWQDNPNFLVNTDANPDTLAYEFAMDSDIVTGKIIIQGLFSGECNVSLKDKEIGSIKCKGGEIQEHILENIPLKKGKNKIELQFAKSTGVNYLGTISFL